MNTMGIPKDLIRQLADILSIRPEGETAEHLCLVLETEQDRIRHALGHLVDIGLLKKEGDRFFTVPWWDAPRIEITLDVPRVSQSVFDNYAFAIDEFAINLRRLGYEIIRPNTHETSIELILSATTIFVLAEFFKPFFGELGKRLAQFIGDSIKVFGNKGLTQVHFKGVRKLGEGYDVQLSIIASSQDEFCNLLAEIKEKLDSLTMKDTDELSLRGENWKVVLRKTRKARGA